MSVDDMLWWLFETFKIVVGTRTIRRVFERKGDAGNRFKKARQSAGEPNGESDADQTITDMVMAGAAPNQLNEHYVAPYTPIANMTTTSSAQAEIQLAQALGQTVYPPPPTHHEIMADAIDDEETIRLELQQIAIQKRELELKLKLKRLQQNKSPAASASTTRQPETPTGLSTLYKPGSDFGPTLPKRDSRSKKKIEESKVRTAERQERMLRDLERRSRRREHLTADWVTSKDIWPIRAQAHLADLMHRYQCYQYNSGQSDRFEPMFQELYQLVDNTKGDWDPAIHDDMLRERTKRKMTQVRSKMAKTGEIIGLMDQFGGWQRADDFSGQQVRDMALDETEIDLQPHELQSQGGAAHGQTTNDNSLHYEPVPDPNAQAMSHTQLPYGTAPLLHHQPSSAQYPLLDAHHSNMMAYGPLPGQQGHGQQDMSL